MREEVLTSALAWPRAMPRAPLKTDNKSYQLRPPHEPGSSRRLSGVSVSGRALRCARAAHPRRGGWAQRLLITFLRSSSQSLSQAAVLSLIFNRSSHLLVVCETGSGRRPGHFPLLGKLGRPLPTLPTRAHAESESDPGKGPPGYPPGRWPKAWIWPSRCELKMTFHVTFVSEPKLPKHVGIGMR